MKTIELGRGIHVPMLTVRDMMEVAERSWQDERKAIQEDLEQSGATAEQRLTVLREHSMRRGTAVVLLVGTMRIDIASDIIRRACMAAKVDVEQVLQGQTPAWIIKSAQRLTGYELPDESESGNV